MLSQNFKTYLKDAQQGNAKTQYQLACCYEIGIDVEKNEKQAFYWYAQAALQGLAVAQFHLALCYKNGIGVEKNQIQAFYWYAQAAKQGDPYAQYNLALCYENGIGVEKNQTQAAYWYGQAAQQGDAYAQYNLALCYKNGVGVEKNTIKIVYWYEQAARQGYANAQYNLALCYENGIGVQKNEINAIYWYMKAAKQELAVAQYNLALCYEDGIGGEKNKINAIYWYKKAAKQKHADAQYNLGLCYKKGIGVKQDAEKALNYIKAAAEQENILAQYWLDGMISDNPDIMLAKAKVSLDCYFPTDLSNKAASQQGFYCGLTAFAHGCNYSKKSPFHLFPSTHEKNESGGGREDDKDVALIELGHTKYTSNGAIYSIKAFDVLAARYNIPGCEAVLGKEYTKEEYKTILCNGIRNNNIFIASCEQNRLMPGKDKGKSAHWVLLQAFWCDEKNNYYFLANHNGYYCAWKFEDLYKSNKQLPTENPLVKGGHLKKFRFSLFKIPVSHQREIINHTPGIKC